MADTKISALASGAPAQAGDEYVIARSGANYKLTGTNLLALVTSTANTFTAAQTLASGDLKMTGSSSGTITFAVPAAAGTNTVTFPAETMTVGFRNVPQSGSAKTANYDLVVGDVGKFIEVGASGAITIPNATFAAGDVVSIFNNTSGAITITCTITTAYIAGTDADKATVSLATRGVATILFLSGTVCVINGNVS
jgi:uncharacterized protein YqgC (DUF456 family)